MNVIHGDKGVVLQIMSERESFNVLLQTRRHLTLVPPEAITHNLMLDIGKHALHLAKLLFALRRRLQSASTVPCAFSTVHGVE